MAKKVKKVIKAKEEAQRFLADVREEYVFRCHDGKIIRNMRELAEALIGMTDETFGYHSNIDKRDFSCWVRDIIGDEKLAKDMENMPNRTMAAGCVATRIAFLSKELV